MIEIILFLTLSNFLVFINFRKIIKFIDIFDKPDNKLKRHKLNTPILGGIVIGINLLIYLFLSLFLETPFKNLNISNKEYFSIFFFITSLFLLGLYDDKFKLNPEKKFFLSIFFSILVLSLNKNLLIQNLTFSFSDRIISLNDFSFFFTIFCIIVLINALNFYDGINGQSLIYLISVLSYLSYQSPLQSFYIVLILVCALVLFFNLNDKTFLGDGGIYLVGSILSILLIYEHNIFKTIRFADEIFLLLILPGFDLLRLTINRLMRGKNAFYGDRNHIHHLLVKKFSLLSSNLILFNISIVPIILFSYFKMDFFLTFLIFLVVYVSLILFLKSNDKKYNYR